MTADGPSWQCSVCKVHNTGPHYGVASECGHCGAARPAKETEVCPECESFIRQHGCSAPACGKCGGTGRVPLKTTPAEETDEERHERDLRDIESGAMHYQRRTAQPAEETEVCPGCKIPGALAGVGCSSCKGTGRVPLKTTSGSEVRDAPPTGKPASAETTEPAAVPIAEPPLIYIAGPYSAPSRAGVEKNIRAAVDLSLLVANAGGMPVCPHANTSHPKFESLQPYEFWIAGTMALMRACHACIMVPGWNASTGARGERAEMLRLGRPVFHELAELRVWIKKWKAEQASATKPK